MIRKIVKKLLWILGGLCVLILIFFVFVIALNCSVPTENRTPYYEGYVALVAEPLAHPEQNGLADLMRAMGPKVFTGWIPNRYDQTAQWDEADRISWSEFRHHPTITEWWEKVWRPNCEKLRVNPEAEPPYWTIASDRLYRRLEGLEKTTPEKQAILEQIEQLNARQQSGPPLTDAELDTLYAYESPYDHAERLSLTPWSRNEEPDAAAYLDEYSPLLDIFAHAVRQPCFIAYTPEPWEMKIHVPVPLPEKSLPPLNLTSLQLTLDQASPELRPLADATRQRAFMRLGAGDLDGSIHDMMTLFHTSCAYKRIPNLTSWLEGDRQEINACIVLRALLQHGHWTDEQLLALQSQWDTLPSADLTKMTEGVGWISQYDLNDTLALTPSLPFRMRLNRRKIWQTLEPFYAQWRAVALEQDDVKRLELYDAQSAEIECRLNIAKTRVDGIHSPSGQFENVYNILSSLCSVERRTNLWLQTVYPDFRPHFMVDSQTQAFRKLGRIGIAMERYRFAEGDYPDTLDALMTKHLLTTDLTDPCSGKKFIYRAEPWRLPDFVDGNGHRCPPPLKWSHVSGYPYLLYSVGWNREDDTSKLLNVETISVPVTAPNLLQDDDLR